ncbi:hypothetical protein QTQ03_08320 [Micromonospora sp. WMMA1363]|uniref:hypothetical protein n=1 Tax=Micromonospora sp. WMMA1363 TaxID=3053985 RepID=UPI00259C807E|nr:hypothetical protein [Micromonospora sp. WMMA1363]MDM4719594.1 hypothetical protein [Micromonospora sp. WMMA1363]
MRYGRKRRREQKKERPFARRLKYESAKETLGKLIEWGGAGVGMLIGLAGTRYGLPVSPAVASTGGAIIGGMVGSQGKAFVVTGFDHLRERRDQRRATAAKGGGIARNGRRSRRHGIASSAVASSRGRASASIAGQVIGGLDNVMDQLNRASRQLANVHQRMWASQNALSVVLAGGRPDVVKRVEAQLTMARGHVHDSAGALKGCVDNLATYRATI